jgi:hypothetical protein
MTTDRPVPRQDGGTGLVRRSSRRELKSVFVLATSGTQATESRSQAKGDFPPDPPDIRRIAILRVALDFPDATPAVATTVARNRIVRSVEQATTDAAP